MAELFSGSGTGYDVAKDMDIQYVGADINPTPVRPGILCVDAISDEVPESFCDADLLFMHPPYGKGIGFLMPDTCIKTLQGFCQRATLDKCLGIFS